MNMDKGASDTQGPQQFSSLEHKLWSLRATSSSWFAGRALVLGLGLATLSNPVASWESAPHLTSQVQIARATQTTTKWAGYMGKVLPAVQSISGGWRIPRLHCSKKNATGVAQWIGIGNGRSLLQTGVLEQCKHGSQFNSAVWEEYPSPPIRFDNLPVRVGNYIMARIRFDHGHWTTALNDEISNISGIGVIGQAWGIEHSGGPFVRQGLDSWSSFAGGQLAEWQLEAAPSAKSLALFSPVNFSRCAVNGFVPQLSSALRLSIRVGNQLLATAGPASHGAFTVRRR